MRNKMLDHKKLRYKTIELFALKSVKIKKENVRLTLNQLSTYLLKVKLIMFKLQTTMSTLLFMSSGI